MTSRPSIGQITQQIQSRSRTRRSQSVVTQRLVPSRNHGYIRNLETFIGCIHNQSSILIMCIKVQIAYQASCIWPQLNSFFQMSVFLCTLLLFFQLHAKAEKPLCRMMGDPKYPLLSKDGDVTIGALFPVHSIETLPSFKFTQKPQLSSCSRFVTCYRRYLFIYLFI